MTELIQESTLAEYEAFVQSHPKGHFAQSSLWAKQKPAWKWRAIVSRGADGRIRGSIAFLIRTMPYIHKTMLYACRGPVCDLDDRETFGELVAAARELAKEYKAYVIKIDPDVPVENEDFRRMLEDFGFARATAARISRRSSQNSSSASGSTAARRTSSWPRSTRSGAITSASP